MVECARPPRSSTVHSSTSTPGQHRREHGLGRIQMPDHTTIGEHQVRRTRQENASFFR